MRKTTRKELNTLKKILRYAQAVEELNRLHGLRTYVAVWTVEGQLRYSWTRHPFDNSKAERK